jgi:hypothetical protein
VVCGREPAPHLSLSGCNNGDAVSWRVIGDELFAVNLEKPPEQMRQHLELVISFYCRFVTLTPRHRTGTYRMYALKPKVLLLIICALAVATVMHASVYLSIDVASLSAEMPPR